MTRSIEFFRLIVEPTVHDYLKRRGDLRLGCLAAIVLNQMADYWAVDGHANNAAIMRDRLRVDCPSFGLISDVADASKHAKLTRKTRSLTTAEQITTPPGLFHTPFGTGVVAEAWVVSVTLDDNTSHALDDAVLAVLAMWQMKLDGLCDRLSQEAT